MFLHAGASLHGHEYSHSPPTTNPPNQAAPRRNAFFRYAFPTPMNRASTYHQPDARGAVDRRPALPGPSPSEPASTQMRAPSTPDSLVKSQRRRTCDLPASRPDGMSEDEASFVSDSEMSQVSTPARRSRRHAARTSTSYLLAHPPPKLRSKQRIIHTRPQLLLQLQQVAVGQRHRPAIDVYPSSAVSRTIIAPLMKRFPRIAGIKRELGIQDIMVVRSEDYAAQDSDPESDGDEHHLRSRELLAVLSPLRTADKAEIVLANGSVWVASPRSTGNNCSYDFVSVDADGHTTTARWVRKQIVPKPPSTPTTTAPSSSPKSPQYKFTFSIIDPNCRRHPIMATLTNSSLDILDAYTTVSQTASRYPPTSPLLPPPVSAPGSDDAMQRTTQPVEEWQKSFISISAVWVALRHGWAPNCRPADITPHNHSPLARSATDAGSPTSSRPTSRRSPYSLAAAGAVVGNDAGRPLPSPEPLGGDDHRRKRPPIMIKRWSEPPASPSGALPRRATSTGAAFMQKRRAQLQQRQQQQQSSSSQQQQQQQQQQQRHQNSHHHESDDQSAGAIGGGGSSSSDAEQQQRRSIPKLNRRAFSGDWNLGLRERRRNGSSAGAGAAAENSLAGMMMTTMEQEQHQHQSELQPHHHHPTLSSETSDRDSRASSLAPPPLPTCSAAPVPGMFHKLPPPPPTTPTKAAPMTSTELGDAQLGLSHGGGGGGGGSGSPRAGSRSPCGAVDVDGNGLDRERGRHTRWKSVSGWFRRASGR
ncbi:hypothetical protein GGR56DRAFT_416373 [Xylariaceae sp. FL0804]|nr:hypothetical protein GGR56DRAFT_416373 [Xylariaceae sp. FL0804]